MKLHENYDWAVLGDHPAALLSAILMRRIGYNVVVVPMIPSASVTLSNTAQIHDPETNYILGINPRAERAWISSFLGSFGEKSRPLLNQLEPDSERMGWFTPSLRIEFGGDAEKLRKEFERELGKSQSEAVRLTPALSVAQKKVHSYWEEYPRFLSRPRFKKDSRLKRMERVLDWWAREKTYPLLRDHLSEIAYSLKGKSRLWLQSSRTIEELTYSLGCPEITEALEGAWTSVTGISSEGIKGLELTHALALAGAGSSFSGGMSKYRSSLMAMAESIGVQVVMDSPCLRIFVENGALIGIQIAGMGKMLGIKGAITGCALEQIKENIHTSGRKPLDQILRATARPQHWKFTFSLAVHAEAIPPGFPKRTIWSEEGAPPIEIEIADPVHYGMGETGEKLIFVRTLFPFTRESIEVEYQRLMSARMFRQVSEILPFLEYHIVRVFPDFREDSVEGRKGFTETYGFTSPDMIPDNLRCYEGQGAGFASGIQKLYVASGESFPVFGSFGPVVAAIEATIYHLKDHCGVDDDFMERLWDFMKPELSSPPPEVPSS